MHNPISTYRLQLNESFTLAQLEALLPYLRDLGITTIYASPIFEATPGSTHGYDGVDPARVAPEIGTLEQLTDLSNQLKTSGMAWLQDIVPNHMAYHQHNTWLVDLLEKGPLSRYGDFFDLTYTSDMYHGRIMGPFLGESLDDVLKNGGLRLIYERDRLFLKSHDNEFPLKISSYRTVLAHSETAQSDATRQWLSLMEQLRPVHDPETLALEWDECLDQLTALSKTDEGRAWIESGLAAINAQPDQLRVVADEQYYRLCAWTEGMRTINYRRFFTVNGLICLNMQNKQVFDQYHDLIKKLVDMGVFQGIRVDHVDGLYNPEGYLQQLRELVGPTAYVVVEKIQQANEPLPPNWAKTIQGTSGYDFLAQVNNLLTDPTGELPFTQFFESMLGTNPPMPKRIRDRKAYILYQHMGGELNNLLDHFRELGLAEEGAAEVGFDSLRLAIGEVLIHCPVYRYYGNAMPLPDNEATAMRTMFMAICTEKPDLERAVSLLEDALVLKPPVADDDYRDRARKFYQRLMQFTGPLMAKGVEDTLMYTYNRFIGHNEVGDAPDRFGMPVADFHRAMQERQQQWPLSMNGLSTHDTKRGEDSRARLNVLTALPNEWLAEVSEWQDLNADLKTEGKPDPNDEYLLYQALLANYTMPTGSGNEIVIADPTEDDFADRFDSYIQKALHEAKRHVSEVHGAGDDDYIEATKAFGQGLLAKNRPFWGRFETFLKRVADFGITNSLAQVVLKNTCPGVPDLYQGAEGWDLSFVDPDNRRPVDFAKRQAWLADFQANTVNFTNLWHDRFSGRVKLFITHKLLQLRQTKPELFLQGDYIPLPVDGPFSKHIMAFARHHGPDWVMVVVPLFAARLCRQQGVADVLEIDWQDTRVVLPDKAPTQWTSAWSSEKGESLLVKDLFGELPVCVAWASAT
jgi:(1->4)-alpha-D-glucan 1-alpha-D-glucosylmutase